MNTLIRRCNRIICTLIILFSLFIAHTGYAHTYLHESNPGAGETVTKNLTEIVLKYETKIENLSSFELWLNDSEQVAVDNITVDQDTMTGKLEEALANGDYTLKWNIIGADGHQVSGEVTFTIQVPEQSTDANQKAGQAEQIDEAIDQSKTDQQNESTTEQQNETSVSYEEQNEAQNSKGTAAQNSELVKSIVVPLALILMGGATWLLLRRKRK